MTETRFCVFFSPPRTALLFLDEESPSQHSVVIKAVSHWSQRITAVQKHCNCTSALCVADRSFLQRLAPCYVLYNLFTLFLISESGALC